MRPPRTRHDLTRRLVVLAGGALFALSVSVALPQTASAGLSANVSGDALVPKAVSNLEKAGILLGRDASSLVPQEYVTRGQLAIYLARALDLADANAAFFTDVVGPEPCFGAVAALYEAGLVTGTTSTTFSPDDLVSRQQAVAWIVDSLGYRVAQGSGSTVPFRLSYFESAEPWLGGFQDRRLIGAAYARAVANGYRLGIVDATSDGWFYPTLPLSRGEMAIMLDRAFVQPIKERGAYPAAVPVQVKYPTQSIKSQGPLVWYLEYQLTALKYCPGPIDGVYDYRTRDAVMAFQKVERVPRDGIANDTFWQHISVAKTPVPKMTDVGYRVEIDITRQVLLMITDNKVWKIVHVSTGAGQRRTRTGHFQIGRKDKGWVEAITVRGRMYFPSYVVSRTAIHGYKSVPSRPASHGCIRVPVWMAEELFYQLPTGTTVDIYYNQVK
jgi:peptidoglycan hydrolase-like protein with peptidoglycan-binding domain